jgi:hypothetical protein
MMLMATGREFTVTPNQQALFDADELVTVAIAEGPQATRDRMVTRKPPGTQHRPHGQAKLRLS